MTKSTKRVCVHCGTWINKHPAATCPECHMDPFVPDEKVGTVNETCSLAQPQTTDEILEACRKLMDSFKPLADAAIVSSKTYLAIESHCDQKLLGSPDWTGVPAIYGMPIYREDDYSKRIGLAINLSWNGKKCLVENRNGEFVCIDPPVFGFTPQMHTTTKRDAEKKFGLPEGRLDERPQTSEGAAPGP